MKGWLTERLGEVCDILDSQRKPVTKRDRTAGSYPYYGATGIVDYVNDYIFDEPLVLVGEDGAKWASGENTAFRVEGKCWVNNHAHVLRPHRDIILDNWLVYFLNHSDLIEYVSGLTVPKLNQGSLREIPIPLPPLPEQKRIVTILDEAFAVISQAIANTEKNLDKVRELFQSTYVAIFDEAVANGYQIKTVAEVTHSAKGSMRTGPFGSQLLHGEFVDEGIAVLGIDNAVSNQFRWDKRRYITEEKYKELSRYRVKPGDILITIMGTCGRCAVVPDDIPTAINTKHLCCITLDTNKCMPLFLHGYFLHHPIAQQFLASKAKGSIMAGLNMGIISELPILLPPLHQQRNIVAKVDSLLHETERLKTICQQKLKALNELKQAILQKAFTGELTQAIPIQ